MAGHAPGRSRGPDLQTASERKKSFHAKRAVQRAVHGKVRTTCKVSSTLDWHVAWNTRGL